MEDRFKLLRIFSVIFRVLAWAGLVLGFLGIGGILVNAKGASAALRGTAVLNLLIRALLFFLVFYTAGETIRVLLAIEQNTRRTGTTP